MARTSSSTRSCRRTLSLPAGGQPPLVVTRTYRAAHNIGHFRFVECSRLTEGRPDGDVTPYDPVFFPFDPDLHDEEDLGRRPVGRREYRAGCRGALHRHAQRRGGGDLTTRPAGLTRTFRLARHATSAGQASATARAPHPDLSPRARVG